MLARDRWSRTQCWVVTRTGDLYCSTRSEVLLRRSLQGLVGNRDLLFQRVELRVVVDLPPFTAQHLIAGLRLLPGSVRNARRRRGLFESRRCRRGRPLVIRTNRTACNQQTECGGADGRDAKSGHAYFPPLCGFACWFCCSGRTTRTNSPSITESGGFCITSSSDCSPCVTSTTRPSSRPMVMGTSFALPSTTVATCSPCERKINAGTGMMRVGWALSNLKWTWAYAPGTSSPLRLSTSTSTSSVREVGSIAFDVRTILP